MRRIDAPEILDSDACSACEVQTAMRVLDRVNRWFGGVVTTQKMVQRVVAATGVKSFSMLEVAAGTGEVPDMVRRNVAWQGITLHVTLLDRAHSHLSAKNPGNSGGAAESRGIVGDAFALPFGDGAFDLVSCNLFAHHLMPHELALFVREGLRVSRLGLLINDLVRHPLHLALVYASFPLMRSRVAWLDGITSVRRAYTQEEIREAISSSLCAVTPEQFEVSRHYLFRMGVIVWKTVRVHG